MHYPDFNRVVIAVKHTEPDRVPLMEASISFEMMGRFFPRT